MHVAVVGAGALGSVYGARLAAAGCAVEVVGRRAEAGRAQRLERVSDGAALEWVVRAQLERVPDGVDAVLVAVPYQELEDAVARAVPSRAPVVVLTPMLPADAARLSDTVPRRIVPGMPGVAAYRNAAGVVRYWLPRGATTLVEAGDEDGGTPALLVEALKHAGMSARIEHGVLSRNAATTVSFMPLAMGLDAAGGIDATLGDEALLSLALSATEEARDLGRAVGKPEAWASILLRFVGPRTLRAGLALARARSPEAVSFVEDHFGRKLRAQNLAMGREMVAMAERMGTRRSALEQLVARLAAP